MFPDRADTTVNEIVNNMLEQEESTPPRLSKLIVDCNKNFLTAQLNNIGTPADDYGAINIVTMNLNLPSAIEFIIDGGGSAITTGEKGHVRIPYSGTILSVVTMADQSGSIVVDIWKDTTANFPPTDADSITASAPPTLSSAQIALDATLTGWTKTFTAGDILAYNVDSATTVTRVAICLYTRRS